MLPRKQEIDRNLSFTFPSAVGSPLTKIHFCDAKRTLTRSFPYILAMLLLPSNENLLTHSLCDKCWLNFVIQKYIYPPWLISPLPAEDPNTSKGAQDETSQHEYYSQHSRVCEQTRFEEWRLGLANLSWECCFDGFRMPRRRLHSASTQIQGLPNLGKTWRPLWWTSWGNKKGKGLDLSVYRGVRVRGLT